jgi:hypothetical protein
MSNQCKEIERKLQIIGIFFKSKSHDNSGKNSLIVSKTELDLDILTINLYTKFHFNICTQCEENELKLLVDRPTDRQLQSNMPSQSCGKQPVMPAKPAKFGRD